ncbi:MAG: phosphate transport system regulator PhoU, partial [Methylococcaceae bacterium]|nr:phosphate transport system regulator PhoU [Methylococcaceae bacterium]
MTYAGDGHSTRHHTSKQFDQELDGIRSQALALGGLVEEQIGLAMKALVENDGDLAQEVIRNAHRVNTLEVEVNEQCTLVLARRQPAGGDLRLVVAVLKTITDLERVGDDAKRIARLALAMGEHYPRKSQLYRLGDFSGRVRMRLK